jgi:hypothetical protein
MTINRRINTNGTGATMPTPDTAELTEAADSFHALLTAHQAEVKATAATLAQLQGVRAELAATQASLAQVRDEAHAAQREHERRMFDTGEAHARAMHEGRAELAALLKAIPERQAELDAAEAAVADALAEHRRVEDIVAAAKAASARRPGP